MSSTGGEIQQRLAADHFFDLLQLCWLRTTHTLSSSSATHTVILTGPLVWLPLLFHSFVKPLTSKEPQIRPCPSPFNLKGEDWFVGVPNLGPKRMSRPHNVKKTQVGVIHRERDCFERYDQSVCVCGEKFWLSGNLELPQRRNYSWTTSTFYCESPDPAQKTHVSKKKREKTGTFF